MLQESNLWLSRNYTGIYHWVRPSAHFLPSFLAEAKTVSATTVIQLGSSTWTPCSRQELVTLSLGEEVVSWKPVVVSLLWVPIALHSTPGVALTSLTPYEVTHSSACTLALSPAPGDHRAAFRLYLLKTSSIIFDNSHLNTFMILSIFCVPHFPYNSL